MWTYVLTDLTGVSLGEVQNATERQCMLAINKVCTASFTVKPTNEILEKVFGQDTLLQVWEDSTLRFYGPVVTAEAAITETGEKTIRINAASPAWRLSLRLLGLSAGGTA